MNIKQNILIVDDDPGFRKTLSDILKHKGYDSVAVDKGQTALEAIHINQPVVALIDLKLEDMSGLDLLKEIKGAFDTIECILLTGNATQKSAIEAVNLGAYGYIQKPYDIEQLLIMIHRAIEKWEANEALLSYAKRLQILRDIDQAILEVRSPQAIGQVALQHIQYFVPCRRAGVLTFDFEENSATLLAAHPNSKSTPATRTVLPLNTFHISDTLKQGKIYLVQDVSSLPQPVLPPEFFKGDVNAWINAPLTAQGQLIGILALGATENTTFEPEHVEITQEVASVLALAIYQARLDEQVQHHAAEMEQRVAELQLAQAAEREQRELAETLREVTGVLSSSLEREQVLRIILEQLARVVEYDGASVMLVSNNALEIVAYRRSTPGPIHIEPLQINTLPHVQELFNHRTPVIIPDTLTDPRWVQLSGTEYVRCWLGVPLVVQNRVIGLLNVNKTQPGFYTALDAELSKALADHAAIAVENAQLFEQAQQEIAGRIRIEATLAEERALLAQRVQERTLELSSANAELARAARLKDEFLAAMSHELRTPLNAILGLSEALQEEVYGAVNKRQHKSLRTIEESGRHLLSLINDILDVSKIEAGKLTLEIDVIPIEPVCQASLRLIKQAAQKKNLKITVTFDKSVTTIQADQRRLKQILVNLLSNAVKFTPAGNNIGLEVSGDSSNQVVNFTVWDTGIGISTDDMKHLFTPFVQLDSSLARQHTGTGLGLTLVNRLTEMHGGGIFVESELHKGSRFTVSLPWRNAAEVSALNIQAAAYENAKTDMPATHRAVIVEDSPPVILLAEDNEYNISTISNYLQQKGYQLVIARDGTEAVARIEEKKPDLILMDIQMPGMDGLEAIRRIRTGVGLNSTPIIALTALTMPGDKERYLTAGANEYMSKPVSLKRLKTIIESFLQQ